MWDRIKCKFGKHVWDYYQQDVVLSTRIPHVPILSKVYSVRTCIKCMKKQHNGFLLKVGDKPNRVSGPLNTNEWKEFNIYTKEEQGEILLNDILLNK